MIKLFKCFGKKEVLFILICSAFIVLQVWIDLKLPEYMSNITILIQTEGSKMADVLKEGGYMLACAFGSLVTAVIIGYCAANVSAAFSRNTRKRVFDKVASFSMEEMKKFSTSSLITRTTNDIRQVQMLIILGLQMLMKAPIMAFMAISKIANKGIEFSVITAIGVGIVMIMITFLVILVLPKFKKIQTLTDNLNRITRENLTGIKVVRAFNAEDYQTKRFKGANEELTNTNLFTQRSMAIMSPVMSAVMSGISLAIYWVGAYLIDSAGMLDKITIFSNMVVFSQYSMQVLMSFMMLVVTFILYPRASVSAKRINEILDTNGKISDGEISQDINDLKGVIEFKNVSFKYPDAENHILNNISFKVEKGQTIAFVGSTGSGKSTLINLIPRFYDTTEGQILIDGVDVKDMTLEHLYNKIRYISQRAVLFSGSIKENVSFGKIKNKKPAKSDIIKAIEVSQAKEFVEKMPKKYDSYISQGGTNVSGGQKQRLSIARAIARNPEIYIFDDSFSALDYKTDYLLRKKLKLHAKEATVLIVAQRIGTVKDADKIVVLDNGKCVGIGTHKNLLNTCKVYKEIASSQLSEKELSYE